MTTPREDDFQRRRGHLEKLSDGELQAYFWQLAERLVTPLIEEARTHTSPSIERSVLLRIGLSSLESRDLVGMMQERGLLGHGAGHLLLQLAKRQGITPREAGLALIEGKGWERLP